MIYLMLEHDSVYEQSSDVLLSAMKLQIQQEIIMHFELPVRFKHMLKCQYALMHLKHYLDMGLHAHEILR